MAANTQRTVRLVLGLSFALALLSEPEASACSCLPPPPPLEVLEQSEAVFQGRVFRVEEETTLGGFSSVLFEVSAVWKGEGTARILVAADNATSCARDWRVGQDYIVYAGTHSRPLEVQRLLSLGDKLSAARRRQLGDPPDGSEPLLSVGGLCSRTGHFKPRRG